MSTSKELHRDAEVEALRKELARLRAANDQLKAENRELRDRLRKYEPEIAASAAGAAGGSSAGDTAGSSAGGAAAGDGPGNYSLGRFESQRKPRQKQTGRRGRLTTAEKMTRAGRTVELYPEGARPNECVKVGECVVWRIEGGQAVLVGYHIYQSPAGETAAVPDTLPNGEYDILIVAAVGWLAYGMQLSLDQVCLLLQTFWNLPLEKSQADALLNQLAKHWGGDFQRLCDILRLSGAVGTDETGWTIGNLPSNAAIFVTPAVLVLLFGCPKGRETLNLILDPEVFRGVLISDDHASYQGLTKAQKCWVHLIRKLIKLVILHPSNALYNKLLEQILEFYHEAKRRAQDKRLGPAGRQRTAKELALRLLEIVHEYVWGDWEAETAADKDFARLMREIDRLTQFGELLVFVENPEVPPHNNASEGGLRSTASARKLNRTSQSAKGAHRRSVIFSVLESLKRSLPRFTLQDVVEAMRSSANSGRSMFEKLYRETRKKYRAASA